ncbi:DnaJ domain-containing protein [Bacillota bacterium LX-D]|nr:DnaJ domain-containing protein [Bacillota bacterium LX-D]
MGDNYEILGVRRGASKEEIQNAYRELVKKYHPDKYRDNPLADLAQEKMKEINEAYNQLLKNGPTYQEPYYQNNYYQNNGFQQQKHQEYYDRAWQKGYRGGGGGGDCCQTLCTIWCCDSCCECVGCDIIECC